LHFSSCILNYKRSLKVGFDGRSFASPAAGVRRYAANLATALLELGEGIEVVALGGPGADAIPAGVGFCDEPLHPPTNAGWTLIGLPRAAAGAGVDLIHAPAYTAPFWAGVPVVLTIHDVSYARHPEWYPYRRDWMRRAFYRRSAHAAAHIVTDSEFSASEIAAAYRIAGERISVVPLGVSPGTFGPVDGSGSCDLPTEVVAPYLLHVGDLHERRNLGVIVDALFEARRHFGSASALSLVLAGVDRGVGEALCALAEEQGARDAVVRLGPVSEPLLRALYQCATALVYPSLYEGFGLPPLEAMACGTPVIASRAASIPEVVGDAGILIEADDVAGWTDAIVKVANDERLREQLKARGLSRASTFTWERTARMTLAVYRQILRT
jgi:glycosyltransferase involved in cell wall biosynthesis